MTEQRRLAAILVADVVGHSTLIGSDEAGTLAQLQDLRTEVIEPQAAKHAGQLLKSVGNGFLIELASAMQAVTCAKAIQEAGALGRLPLRIGNRQCGSRRTASSEGRHGHLARRDGRRCRSGRDHGSASHDHHECFDATARTTVERCDRSGPRSPDSR